jgi:hypothetical protein
MNPAAAAIKRWREHPSIMVEELFHVERHSRWVERGSPPNVAHQDPWQEQVLEDFPHHPAQVMLACKGPGKTAVLAWLGWNFLLTREHCKIAGLSITGKNLSDNLWPEMAVWQKKTPILSELFEWGAERIRCKAHPETWFMTAKTWPQSPNEQQLGETLAGLWAPYVMILMDEAGGIPVPVLRAAEAILGQAGVQGREAHVVMAGNTTSSDGCLYEAAINRRHLWIVYEITADPDDPKRTSRIDIEYARQQIREYGRDNPWVMINILAKFPLQGVNTMISADQIKACIGRHLPQRAYDWAPRILGGDVADFGDDATVLYPRQGDVYFAPLVIRHMDPVQIAGHWGNKANEWQAHAIHADTTGGYGSGPIAILRDQGFTVQGVNFSEKPFDPKFYNKRAEMLWTLCEHLKGEGVSIASPGSEFLIPELSTMTYGYKGDKILIEDKKLIKARLGRSPDYADAAACTHAYPVAVPRDTRAALFEFDLAGRIGKSVSDYDPLTRA